MAVNVHQSVKITNSVDKYPDYQNGPWLHAVFQKQPGGRQGSNADKRNRDLVAADVSGCPGSDPQGAAQGFHQVIQQGYAAKYNGIFGDFLQPDIQDEFHVQQDWQRKGIDHVVGELGSLVDQILQVTVVAGCRGFGDLGIERGLEIDHKVVHGGTYLCGNAHGGIGNQRGKEVQQEYATLGHGQLGTGITQCPS